MIRKAFTLAVVALMAGSGAQALKSQVYATGFSLPVAMAQDPTSPSRQFVVEQRGLIRTVVNGVVLGTNFLDLSAIVNQTNNEGGLLGMAFHPQYATNRYFYVNYTDAAGDTRIVRFTAPTPTAADPGSAQQVIFIDQPFSNHNGGTIRFGPLDGYLYIGMGDGGSSNDPGNRAQTITNMLLGKMLRLDVNRDDFPADPATNYGIPATNPFVGASGDDEIWSYGLRNPWKFAFDNPSLLGTGGTLIADVGQSAWEEVDYEPPLAGGRNYGWRVYEGNNLTGLGGGVGPFTFPIHAYDHGLGNSITGGYVYRGLLLGDFFGKYFFADYGSKRIWAFDLVINPVTGEGSAANVVEHTADIVSGASLISSIDVDADGELYVLDYRSAGAGRIVKILPENRTWATSVAAALSTPLIGGARHLSAADGKVLISSQVEDPAVSRSFRSAFFLNMATDMTAPSFFDVFVDVAASASIGAGDLKVYMKNWGTGNLDLVGTTSISATMSTKQFLNVPAANYRRPADGAIQLYFLASNPGAYASDRYTIRYDRVKVVPR